MTDFIENVSLQIFAKNGNHVEIKLDPWQVDAVATILGLIIKLPDLNSYEMSDRHRVEERRKRLFNCKSGEIF